MQQKKEAVEKSLEQLKAERERREDEFYRRPNDIDDLPASVDQAIQGRPSGPK